MGRWSAQVRGSSLGGEVHGLHVMIAETVAPMTQSVALSMLGPDDLAGVVLLPTERQPF